MPTLQKNWQSSYSVYKEGIADVTSRPVKTRRIPTRRPRVV